MDQTNRGTARCLTDRSNTNVAVATAPRPVVGGLFTAKPVAQPSQGADARERQQWESPAECSRPVPAGRSRQVRVSAAGVEQPLAAAMSRVLTRCTQGKLTVGGTPARTTAQREPLAPTDEFAVAERVRFPHLAGAPLPVQQSIL